MTRLIRPPIKSQGIKTKLVPWIKSLIDPNGARRWIEPFLGTGVVAFNSGFRNALLSDINPHIIDFYMGVQSGEITPSLVRRYLEHEGERLRNSPEAGYDHFRFIRDRFNRHHDPLDFLFLSRSGFNGMMRFNKRGEWNIPFCKKPDRFRPAYVTKIVNQVRDVATVMEPHWELKTSSFEYVIADAGPDDIIYCDPPYAGRYVDYYNRWTDDDELRLFELLSSTPAQFILSTWHHNQHRANAMIDRFWGRFNIVTHDHFYHAGGKLENRRSVVEALVFNFPAEMDSHNHGTRGEDAQQMRLPVSWA